MSAAPSIESFEVVLPSREALIGSHTRQWAEAMITARGIAGTRVLIEPREEAS